MTDEQDRQWQKIEQNWIISQENLLKPTMPDAVWMMVVLAMATGVAAAIRFVRRRPLWR